MATSTERFGFTKPAGSDPASVVPLNSNIDLIELYLGRTQDSIAPLYDDTETYSVGDLRTYESRLYKCNTDISTPETFDPEKWDLTIAVQEGGGGGGSSEAEDINYDNTTSHLTADNVQEAIDEVVANANTASEDILTLQNVQGYDEYDETQTYAVGDYAIYNNIVYECTTAVSTAEPFDSTKWTATSIEQIIDGVKGDVSQLNSSLTQLNGLNVVKRITTPASVVSFSDGSNLPMPSLKVGIDPIQDLHGYDKPWVGGAGKNILNVTNFSVGETKTVGGVSCTYDGDGTFTLNGTTTQANVFFNLNYINSSAHALPTNAPFNIGYAAENNSGALVRIEAVGGTRYAPATFGISTAFGISDDIDRTTTTATSSWARLQIQDSGVTLTNVKIRPFVCMSSNKLTAYEPYENICPISGWDEANVVVSPTTDAEDGTTYNIQFTDGSNPLTVYGGTLDVISGLLTVTDEYIASYNGETLPATWISDRDVYTEGTIPTTGAEVCYELATPQTYQLTPTQVKSLLGQNNVWADTGDILEVDYTGVLNFS